MSNNHPEVASSGDSCRTERGKQTEEAEHLASQDRAGDAGAARQGPRRRRGVGKTLDRSRPLTKQALQAMAEELLRQMGMGDQYLGFTMVAISNEFWRDQVSAVDFKRRLLLLPHCLKHAEGCPADYDEFGLDCRKCGACSVADFKVKAEELGYKVLVSEGTPIVLKIIVSGHVDAIGAWRA